MNLPSAAGRQPLLRRPFVAPRQPLRSAALRITGISLERFYIGAHVGAAWVDLDETTIAAAPAGFPSGRLSNHDRGFVYGGQVGFNWHIGRFVIGPEGQLSGADFGRRSITTDAGIAAVPFAFARRFDVDSIATLAGRFGITFDQILVYGKAGAAWLDPRGKSESGWMAGLGAEYAFTRNWSAKVEYNFLDFGSDRFAGNGFATERDLNMHLVKLGINYRFGPF
jgi:outer membrane immunogenic protein